MNIIRYEGPRENPSLVVFGKKVEALGIVAQRSRREPMRELCFRLGRQWRRHFREWESGTAEFLIALAPDTQALKDRAPLTSQAIDTKTLRVELAKLCLSLPRRSCSWIHVLTPEATNVVAVTLYQNAIEPAGHA